MTSEYSRLIRKEPRVEPEIPAPPKRTMFAGDPEATWEYWSPNDTAERGVPEEWVWERLRYRRDQLLASTDFRIVGDAPWDIKEWIEYRDALRNLPATISDPRLAIWPVPPEGK